MRKLQNVRTENLVSKMKNLEGLTNRITAAEIESVSLKMKCKKLSATTEKEKNFQINEQKMKKSVKVN